MSMPKYPNIKVSLVGQDGNAFAILGRVQRQMNRAKLTQDQIKEFIDEATTGDYDHLLQTCLKYVEVN